MHAHRRFIALLVASCVSVVAPSAHAAEPLVTVRLGLDAMERGYTVRTTDNAFFLGIFPGVFSEAGTATILSEEANLPAPEGFTQVSPQYVYDVSMSEPHVLTKPVTVALATTSTKPWKKQVAFFNRIAYTWQLVPSWVQGDGRIRAFLHFPYSRVAVFEQAGVLTNGMNLQAEAYAVLTQDAQTILLEHDADEVRPLASLTKLMTALVVLEENPSLSGNIQYSSADDRIGAKLGLRVGETVTVHDLFFATLTMSANNGAAALARSTGMSESAFVTKMNAKAVSLGLLNTHFDDPTGLDLDNVSTAAEYAVVAREAFRFFSVLQATTIANFSFTTLNTHRGYSVHTTNAIVGSDLYLTGSKTGYLPDAGYNLVLRTRSGGVQYLTVLLGHATSAGRFDEAARLARLAPSL